MNFYKIILNSFFILLIVISNLINAQEQLVPLGSNLNLPIIKTNKNLSKTTTTITPLNLPFFDDFSYAYKSPYPSNSLWLDSSVYINTDFAIAPITLGVATFDGLSKKGYPYNINAPVSISAGADTLKSLPINLHSTSTHTYVTTDSICISFYYQAEGFGEAPEPNDSLCLDFFKPNQNKWQKVWGVKGYNPSAVDTNFYRVRVPIADTAYLDSTFQFRFRNKATISGSLDHWHIDYVQIKDLYYYNDTILNDAAYVYKPSSFLKNYSVMPFRQYNQTLEQGTSFSNFFRSNNSIAVAATYSYSVRDRNNTLMCDTNIIFPTGILPFPANGYYSGAASKPGFSLNRKPFSNIGTFADSTYYQILHILSPGSNNTYKANDTISYIQSFSNYYAYDDGTAEQGYYLNAYGAKTAVRFTLNEADTLKSVRIYFDPIIDGTAIQSSSFRVVVWDAGSGGPGSIVYKDSLTYPFYLSGSYNKMPTFNLTSCLPLGVGTYYIGIQQTTNKGLNIGFDRNTNHKDALFYDIGNGWVQSAIPGSLMINPVMGCTYPVYVGMNELETKNKFQIFPNPAQNSISISYPGNQLESAKLEILTSLGQLVYTKTITSNETIDVSNLSNGLYFIHLKCSNLNVSSQKLIISK